tara:strand:- start:54 stop:557 length:504 start_codon:yes stop_codon:yes gene_type:complete
MEPFLKKYSQLANKNTNIVITLGKRKNEHIFDCNIPEKTVHSIISHLTDNYKIRKNYVAEIIYIKNTDQITHIKNTVVHSIVHDTDIWCGEAYLMVNRKFIIDNQTIPSYSTYDNTRDIDVLEMLVDNSVTFRFVLEDGCYTVAVVVNKPCSYEKIVNILNIVHSLM